MKWILLFLAINANILAGAAAYRIWIPPETPAVINPVSPGMFALHKDHVALERQHLALYKQLAQCLGRAI